jgi:hypothetical protein
MERRANFFIWIRCNPLKSPDSTKGIQGNPRSFAWFSLDFLGGDSLVSCILMLDTVEFSLVDRRDVAQLNGLSRHLLERDPGGHVDVVD